MEESSWYNRMHYSRSNQRNRQNYPSNRNNYGNYAYQGSSYDYNRDHNFYGHRQHPYDKQQRRYLTYPARRDSPLCYEQEPQQLTESPIRDLSPVQLSPQEAKTMRLINAARSQNGIIGELVLLQSDGDSPAVILQNALQTTRNGTLSITQGQQPQKYELKINEELFGEGEFLNKQTAKSGLCELALEKLRKTCFSIIKKKNYEEISTEDICKSESNAPTANTMEGSKAHLMMLKMGWGGKGLGVNEQGDEKAVAETITQNVTKEGLGGNNIMSKINDILKEFAVSTKVTTLAFDSGFTKEERAHIHNLAAKLNLKSKSEGKEENRRITIQKKIARWDLVKELLLANCENDSYKLIIPSDFEDMWSN